MDCKILEIDAQDGLITAARYRCSIGDIETEGWWYFRDPVLTIPFENVQESDVIGWIVDQAGAGIEANLMRQAQAKTYKTVAPWLPQTFTPSL